MTGAEYRYRVMGYRDESDVTPRVLEDFAYDRHDARSKAAFHCRWGYTAWVEQQLIVEPPAWERVS
jgi:hypothetical protein